MREYLFLVEKEAMWAQMLMQVLRDNDVPCTAIPVRGAGLSMKAGIRERLQVYVPPEKMEQASDLLQMLFSEESPV